MSTTGNRPATQMGFTLLEVLIALTLLSLMMVVLFGGLRFGARGWDAAEARVEAAGDRSLVQSFIRQRLMQARPIVWGQNTGRPSLAFVGERDFLRFVAPLPARRGQGGLYLFTLELVETDDNGQLIVTYRLFHPDTLEDSLKDEHEKRTVLLEDVQDIELEYFGPEEANDTPRWQSSWRERQQLPTLVRLRLDWTQPGIDAWPQLVVPLRLVDSDKGPGPLGTGGVDFGPLPH